MWQEVKNSVFHHQNVNTDMYSGKVHDSKQHFRNPCFTVNWINTIWDSWPQSWTEILHWILCVCVCVCVILSALCTALQYYINISVRHISLPASSLHHVVDLTGSISSSWSTVSFLLIRPHPPSLSLFSFPSFLLFQPTAHSSLPSPPSLAHRPILRLSSTSFSSCICSLLSVAVLLTGPSPCFATRPPSSSLIFSSTPTLIFASNQPPPTLLSFLSSSFHPSLPPPPSPSHSCVRPPIPTLLSCLYSPSHLFFSFHLI